MKKYLIFLILISVAALFGSRFSNASQPSDFGLKEGDLISAIFSDDPDVYIVNEHGYKRLFLNPDIFQFYTHLGGFFNVKLVTKEVIDLFPTSGLFRDCESNDQKVYGVDIEGEDTGQLHWVNTTGDQAVKDDSDFFKKVFCINKKEFDWYPKAISFNSVTEVPKYDRIIETTTVSTQERLEAKAETKSIGKVIICHYPPENIQAYQTLTIDASALKAHLDHGDTVGSCLSPTPISTPLTSSIPTVTPIVSISPSPSVSASFSPTPAPTFTVTPIPTTIATPSPTASQSSSPTLTPTPTPTSTTSPTPTISSSPTPTPTSAYLPSPTSVTATSVAGKISVTWSGTATKYVIYRSVNGVDYIWHGSISGYSYDDFYNLVSNSIYRYNIVSCDNAGFSCYMGKESNFVTYSGGVATPTPTPSNIPSGAVVASDGTWCYDSDGFGTYAYVKGYCQDNSGKYWDYCDSNAVKDYYCMASSGITTIKCTTGRVECSNAYACSDGVCVAASPTPTSTPSTSSVSYDSFSRNIAGAFSRDLYFGLIGNDVKQLQALLANEVGYSANLITGYFGRITRDAVKRLQEKYGVKPVSGYFGEITRKTLIKN